MIAKVREHISAGFIMWAASGVLGALVGFGVWTVSEIHVTQVQAASVTSSVDDLKHTVESFQTSVDALNVKVDNSSKLLYGIAGSLGVKSK